MPNSLSNSNNMTASVNSIPFPRMHVSLYVSDLEKSMAFYNAFFGRQPDKIRNGYAKYILPSPSLVISFIENPALVNPLFGHLGFQVETKEEMETRLGVARDLKLVSKEETGINCCYAVQDKFWAGDPDGYQWEVYYFHEDAEFIDPRFEDASAQVCCMPLKRSEKKKIRLSDLAKLRKPGSDGR